MIEYGSDVAAIRKAVEDATAELAAEVKRLTEELDAMIEDRKRLTPLMENATARIARLEAAVRWALGEEGEFPPRPDGYGLYWWRGELRERTARRATSPKGEKLSARLEPDDE